MSTKTMGIGFVVIIVILIGGYFVYKSMGSSVSATAPQDQQATSTAQDQAAQVQGQDVKVGTGAEAKPGDTVSVLYVGKFQDGTVFDSSEMHKDPKTGSVPPLTFVLGSEEVIPGFQIGVNTMKVGGERILVVPPSLGYRDQDVKDPVTGKVVIPANSTLVFQVQLVKVVPAPPVKAAQ